MKVSTLPKPWQVGQTPSGLLNENSAGSGRSAAVPQWEHSQRSLHRSGGRSPSRSSSRPSPRRNAASHDSASRASSPRFQVKRSTTTCTSGAPRFSRGNGSSGRTSPARKTRV